MNAEIQKAIDAFVEEMRPLGTAWTTTAWPARDITLAALTVVSRRLCECGHAFGWHRDACGRCSETGAYQGSDVRRCRSCGEPTFLQCAIGTSAQPCPCGMASEMLR